MDWQQRLELVVGTMEELSRHEDPQDMVRSYGERVKDLFPMDRRLSLTRRGVEAPSFRIARSTTWEQQPDPWRERDRLPVMEGGLLGELMDADVPRFIEDLDVDADDPAHEYFAGMRSLLSIPVFDKGAALNVVVLMSEQESGFDPQRIPEVVWTTNLLGRATHSLVLARELRVTNDALDRELTAVAEIQRSLLPEALPILPGMLIAVAYRTAARAGGDYYDLFSLPDDRTGLLVADVSGHGTPAAVIMAITHSLAHTYAGPAGPPGRLLEHLNDHLVARYTDRTSAFVTAFYGVYDPATRVLAWSSAGHNPPRVHRTSGEIVELGGGGGPPLGVVGGSAYVESSIALGPGDRIAIYTDGIPEARDPDGAFFGLDRLDHAVQEGGTPKEIVDLTMASLDTFANGRAFHDDRTLLVVEFE